MSQLYLEPWEPTVFRLADSVVREHVCDGEEEDQRDT